MLRAFCILIVCALASTQFVFAATPASTQPTTRSATTTRAAQRLHVSVSRTDDGRWAAQVGLFRASGHDELRDRMKFTLAAMRADPADGVALDLVMRGDWDAALAKELEGAAAGLGFARVQIWAIKKVPPVAPPQVITPDGPPIAPFGIRARAQTRPTTRPTPATTQSAK